MKCADCANYNNGECLTMLKKPKVKFCFTDIDKAIKAEKDIIEYVFKAKGMTNAEAYRVSAGARDRINELEDRKKV